MNNSISLAAFILAMTLGANAFSQNLTVEGNTTINGRLALGRTQAFSGNSAVFTGLDGNLDGQYEITIRAHISDTSYTPNSFIAIRPCLLASGCTASQYDSTPSNFTNLYNHAFDNRFTGAITAAYSAPQLAYAHPTYSAGFIPTDFSLANNGSGSLSMDVFCTLRLEAQGPKANYGQRFMMGTCTSRNVEAGNYHTLTNYSGAEYTNLTGEGPFVPTNITGLQFITVSPTATVIGTVNVRALADGVAP